MKNLSVKGFPTKCVLEYFLYAPNFGYSILYIFNMDDSGLIIAFGKGVCNLSMNNRTLVTVTRVKYIYVIDNSQVSTSTNLKVLLSYAL